MDLTCYLGEGWDPQIRPAEVTREWMDGTRFAYAYRCLPLTTANSHGWEILSPIGFDAIWNGGVERDDVTINLPPDTPAGDAPFSLFGEGVLTFHINALFRTPPGWNLWVGGSPNRPKDGIYPLTGVVETDWSPYSFTMNWRFTRRNHRVRFAAGEPICFIFPVQRAALETVRPRFVPLESEPQLAAHHAAWSVSRSALIERIQREHRPLPAADQWQKRYYRGIDMTEQTVIPDHQTKLRLLPFGRPAPHEPAAADGAAPLALQTDTAALGAAIGAVAVALQSGALQTDDGLAAMAKRLCALGLGESEAIEVVWKALDAAERDAA